MSAGIASIAWSAELSTLAARFGSAPAVSDGIKAISYTELARNAHEVAGQLTLRRIAPGEPVGTLLPNGTAAVWTSYGVTLSGACETLVSWNSTEAETLWAVSLAKCRLMVTTKQREAALRSMGVVAAAEGASDIWEAEAERRVAVLSKHKSGLGCGSHSKRCHATLRARSAAANCASGSWHNTRSSTAHIRA